jgi:dienelactone hydrolase
MGRGLQALFLLKAALACAAASAAPQEVRFNSLDGTVLTAWVFQPQAQPSKGTVVALHGCGGLYSTRASRQDQFNPRHQAMAELLVAQGYTAVFPDSLRSRGESELCTQKMGTRSVTGATRRADALAALAWVAAQPWASPGRIALLGWSHGGSTVLGATDATRADVKAQATRAAVAIAFYPGCGDALKRGYQPQVPLALMLAEKDDWTPAAPCIALGKAVGAEVNVYPDSYHDFDNPVGTVRLRPDVPNGAHPGQGVRAGRNPAAREQAYARLLQRLAQAFP